MRQGHVSNRWGIIRGFVVGGTVLSLLAVIACGPGEAPTPTPTQPSVVATPTPALIPTATPTPGPKRGGVLRTFTQTDGCNATLDPVKQTCVRGQMLVASLFSNLIRYDPLDSAKIVPDLAKSWKLAGPGIYVFEIRNDAKFVDGTPVTAEDVAYSLRRNAGELSLKQQNGRIGPELLEIWGGAKVTGPYEVTVINKPESAVFLDLLATAHTKIFSKKQIETLTDAKPWIEANPIGSGPFKFKEWKHESFFEVERRSDYVTSNAEGAKLPYLDGVITYIITDRSAALAALQGGQLDLFFRFVVLSPSEAKLVQDFMGPKVTIEKIPDASLRYSQLNALRPPFTDPRVVRAFWVAMDRPSVKEIALEGLLLTGALLDPRVVPDSALSFAELEQYPGLLKPDYELAKKLLAEAGFPNGLELSLAASRKVSNYVDVAQVLLAGYKKAGITFKDHKVEEGAAGDVRRNKCDYDLMTTSTGGFNFPTPMGQFTKHFSPSTCVSEDQVLFNMISKAGQTLDPADRNRQYREIQKYIFTNMSFTNIPIGLVEGIVAKRSYVKGHAWTYTIFDGYMYDTVWLEQ